MVMIIRVIGSYHLRCSYLPYLLYLIQFCKLQNCSKEPAFARYLKNKLGVLFSPVRFTNSEVIQYEMQMDSEENIPMA